MKSSPHVCCDVDNIIIYGSDARVYVLNSALQVIWVACGGVSKPLSISLFSVGRQRLPQMAVAHETWVNGMFANLDSEQLDLLAGLLEQLGDDEE